MADLLGAAIAGALFWSLIARILRIPARKTPLEVRVDRLEKALDQARLELSAARDGTTRLRDDFIASDGRRRSDAGAIGGSGGAGDASTLERTTPRPELRDNGAHPSADMVNREL